jgi:hypothetical protein
MTTVELLFPVLTTVYLHGSSRRAAHRIFTYTAPEAKYISLSSTNADSMEVSIPVSKVNCNTRWKPPASGTPHFAVDSMCCLESDRRRLWVTRSDIEAIFSSIDTLSCQPGKQVYLERTEHPPGLFVSTSLTVLVRLPILPVPGTRVAAMAVSHADA